MAGIFSCFCFKSLDFFEVFPAKKYLKVVIPSVSFFLGAPGRSPGAPEPPRKEKYRLGKYFFRGAAPETPRPGSAPGKKKTLLTSSVSTFQSTSSFVLISSNIFRSLLLIRLRSYPELFCDRIFGYNQIANECVVKLSFRTLSLCFDPEAPTFPPNSRLISIDRFESEAFESLLDPEYDSTSTDML